jgi:DNA-binding response OmpR family regulator
VRIYRLFSSEYWSLPAQMILDLSSVAGGFRLGPSEDGLDLAAPPSFTVSLAKAAYTPLGDLVSGRGHIDTVLSLHSRDGTLCPRGRMRRGQKMRVLLVEDEERLADTIARGLRREGMAIDVALDGRSALTKAAVNTYDVVVLDRNLPAVHGDDVCRELISRESTARILMLTAAGSIQDRVEGLDLGADDYLPKPFALKELVARIRALGRRPSAPVATVLTAGDLILDPARRLAERAGHDLALTKKEFGILQVLLAAEGRVVSAEEMLEKVWDENADPFTNVVRVTIMTLRRKIGEPPLIETVPGVGYRI